jgi:hypothetical protein
MILSLVLTLTKVILPSSGLFSYSGYALQS